MTLIPCLSFALCFSNVSVRHSLCPRLRPSRAAINLLFIKSGLMIKATEPGLSQ